MESQRTWKDRLVGTLKGAGIVSVLLLGIVGFIVGVILIANGSSAAFGKLAFIPQCLVCFMTIVILLRFAITDTRDDGKITMSWVIGVIVFMAIVLGCLLITGLIAYFSGHRVIALILDVVCDVLLAGYLVQDFIEDN